MTSAQHHNDLAHSPAPYAVLKKLDAAHRTSAWLSWACFGLATIWWGLCGYCLIRLVGLPALANTPPEQIMAGLTALAIPGLILILAGLFAREKARSHAVNEIILEASARLLMPAETMGQEATSLAEEMIKATAAIDRAMGHALSAMKAISAEIGDERARLESVTYASADNARELAERLGSERTGLESLARDLREQTALLNKAIPEQAQMMVRSAQAAAQEVSLAEEALQARLSALDQTSRTLAQKIASLDELAATASERHESLVFAINRVEEKLEQSRNTVESASRASELAAAAATTTGDRLLDAVTSALKGARQASAEIQAQTEAATAEASAALNRLKEMGEVTATSIRSAGLAARAELNLRTDQAEPARIDNTHHDTSWLASDQSPEPAMPDQSADTLAGQTEPPAPVISSDHASPKNTTEEDLFEAQADRMASALADFSDDSGQFDETPQNMDIFEPETELSGAETTSRPVTNPAPQRTGQSLSEIIADMEKEENADLSREETAENLIRQLEKSGIKLKEIFRAKDIRKIALTARKGDYQRRTTINKLAGRQVDRVRQRLRGNLELTSLARNFIDHETEDALNALEKTQGSRKNASARLATFLLLDAALD